MASTTTENLQVTSEAVAGYLDAPHAGPPVTLDGIDSLDGAGPRDLAFCVHADPAMVAASDAGAIICPSAVDAPGAHPEEQTLIHHERPRAAFIRVTRALLLPAEERTVHPTAVVAEGATVGRDCHVGPGAYIDGCVTLEDGCAVGAGSVLGTPGFGYTRDEDGRLLRQPHVGTVVVEADAEIGPNCVVDRAVFDRTVVGRGAALSGGVHLAHQARVGSRSTVAFGSGLAGGATLGERVTVHPSVTVATDVVVGDSAELGMGATVLDAVPADTRVVGTPARAVGPAADGA
jgi:UDP-3-O-[3-hydroxymyristoyl] glucosamine N-acyltransferase